VESQLSQARQLAAQGDYARACELLERLLTPTLKPSRRAQVLALLAHQLPRQGESHRALRRASEATALSAQLGDATLSAQALCALGYVYAQFLMGREALETTLAALRAARQAGHRGLEAWALNRLGVAYSSLGQAEQACHYTAQALEIAQSRRERELLFSCLNNLAYYWLQLQAEAQRDAQPERARRALEKAHARAEEALQLGRSEGGQFYIAIALSNLVEARLADGSAAGVQPLIDEFEALSGRHGYAELLCQAQVQRARIQADQGDTDAAVKALNALMERSNIGPKLRRQLCRTLYEVHKGRQEHALALQYLEQLNELERQVARDTMALQTEAMLIRQEFQQAQARAEHALQDARQARERAQQLEQEQAQLREQAAEWGRIAHEDALTGLHNRRHAEFALPLLLERARQEGGTIALALLDIDHFKQVNDSLGHGMGDQVLQQVAQLLRRQLRGADLLARVGGEEFMLVFVAVTLVQAQEICERLRLATAGHDWASLAPGLRVTVSLGLCAGAAPPRPQVLVEGADQALYAAKRGGRDRVEFRLA
jgi:diguanylate cyclase (GGDEF)-like protein